MHTIVFVYGSLKRNQNNHWLMREIGARFLRATIARGFALYDLGSYPACVLTGDRSPVVGELYEVDADGLERLDHFEGCPTHYARTRTLTDAGRVAWVYVMDQEQAEGRGRRIKGGRWTCELEGGAS
jgi:gamma-glutamylcyclotransferase (GGCT)/AIG2-like uncharacterized protein YtfP